MKLITIKIKTIGLAKQNVIGRAVQNFDSDYIKKGVLKLKGQHDLSLQYICIYVG